MNEKVSASTCELASITAPPACRTMRIALCKAIAYLVGLLIFATIPRIVSMLGSVFVNPWEYFNPISQPTLKISATTK